VLARLLRDGWLKPDEEVLVFNTGAAQKYLEALPPELPRLDMDKPDAIWTTLAR
jgi:threonine synthase